LQDSDRDRDRDRDGSLDEGAAAFGLGDEADPDSGRRVPFSEDARAEPKVDDLDNKEDDADSDGSAFSGLSSWSQLSVASTGSAMGSATALCGLRDPPGAGEGGQPGGLLQLAVEARIQVRAD
jgi:hypothetical protein